MNKSIIPQGLPPLILDPIDCGDPGPQAQIAWRTKGELYVDDQYQRDLNSKRSQGLIDVIARKFQWKKFGILQTTLQGAVVDGQHRHAGAMRRPDIKQVPCMVWDIPPKEAALMFVGLNRDRVNITHQAVFKAELKAGDPVAVAIKKMCDEVGVEPLTYPMSTRQLKPNQTTATQTLKHQMSIDAKRCQQTLECCIKAKVTMSSTILMMVFRELTLGAPVSRVMAMLTSAISTYVPEGHMQKIPDAVAPEQTTPGVKKYESGTFMSILDQTFKRAGWQVEIKNSGSQWRESEFKIDDAWIGLRAAVEKANKLREVSGFAPLSIPR